jgi:N-acetylglucosaminyldiphosphoundecaprenol N-acetyl-beta-D-mannosaminyltransferase
VPIFELEFAAVTLNQATEAVFELVPARRRSLVVTVNTDILVQFHQAEPDSSFRAACESAALILADGMPIVWASRLVGRPLPERVAGVELLVSICLAASKRQMSVFFLGGAAGSAEGAASVLGQRAQDFIPAGIHVPPMGFEHDPKLEQVAVDYVNRVKPDILFVAFGAPKQETWVHLNRHRLDFGVAVGVGGAFELVSGTLRRAPRWLQRMGGEWVWRLAQEPRRLWRRYLIRDMKFLPLLLRELRNRK